jgi:hypothetical protein
MFPDQEVALSIKPCGRGIPGGGVKKSKPVAAERPDTPMQKFAREIEAKSKKAAQALSLPAPKRPVVATAQPSKKPIIAPPKIPTVAPPKKPIAVAPRGQKRKKIRPIVESEEEKSEEEDESPESIASEHTFSLGDEVEIFHEGLLGFARMIDLEPYLMLPEEFGGANECLPGTFVHIKLTHVTAYARGTDTRYGKPRTFKESHLLPFDDTLIHEAVIDVPLAEECRQLHSYLDEIDARIPNVLIWRDYLRPARLTGKIQEYFEPNAKGKPSKSSAAAAPTKKPPGKGKAKAAPAKRRR